VIWISSLTTKPSRNPVERESAGEFNDPMIGHTIAYAARTQINRKTATVYQGLRVELGSCS
jgi:hypothetical protein